MWRDDYVNQKLRELEAERRRAPRHLPSRATRSLGPLVRLTGKTLRVMGENLELWATPAPQSECRCEGPR
jgi:hypothetical protein